MLAYFPLFTVSVKIKVHKALWSCKLNALQDSGLLGYHHVSLGTASRRFERTQCLYLKGVMGYKKSDSPFFILPPPFQPRKMRAQKFLPIISKTPDIRHCVTSQNTSLLKLDRCRNVDSRYHTTLLYYSSIKPRCHFPVYFPSNYIRSCTVPFFFFFWMRLNLFMNSL